MGELVASHVSFGVISGRRCQLDVRLGVGTDTGNERSE